MPDASRPPARSSNLDWPVTLVVIALHLGALLAFVPAFFSWSALIAAIVLYWISGGLGITLGFHRLLTHRSFRTPKIVEYFLTICGCLTLQGSPAQWVGTHRIHHAESDGELDPHSPRHGFAWAHAFWFMAKQLHGRDARDSRYAASDLLRDPVFRAIDRFNLVPPILVGIALFLIGGWSWVIWGVCVRTVFLYHSTWLVNSASHTWGYRTFKTTEQSTNNWWVAMLSFGEGWHNNHHAFQRSAAHGLRWWELDMTYLTILAMEAMGLASEVVKPDRQTQIIKSQKLAAKAAVKPKESIVAPIITRVLGGDQVP